MLFVLPYRAKNPPAQFPYVTVGLMVLNVLSLLCTCNSHFEIRDSVVARFAVSHSNLNPLTVLTAMFLHGSILHIAGNMLFLWIFGAATEGRSAAIALSGRVSGRGPGRQPAQ